MTRPRKSAPTPLGPEPGSPHALAATQLTELVGDHEDLELIGEPTMASNSMQCRIRISTAAFSPGPGGLEVQPHEDLVIEVGPFFPLIPPKVSVEHLRWLGFPHVLQGSRLCIHLDNDREWSPAMGMTGLLNRVWGWFDEAIGGRFDPRTAMHHAVGGVQHWEPNAASFVVRSTHGELRPGIHRIVLKQRTDRRIDLVDWNRAPGPDELGGLAIVLTGPLPLGAGSDLPELLMRIVAPVYRFSELPRRGFPDAKMLAFRLNRAATLAGDQPLPIIVAARNLALDGPGAYDLVALTVDADAVRATVGEHPDGDAPRSGTAKMTFLRMDDTRSEISTRRDDRRPVQWFADKRVEIWGCGALGSWIAEVLVRAGLQRLTLRDSSIVTSGLLVRQNYREQDVGQTKADALAERLRDIADTVEVLSGGHAGYDLAETGFPDCDLLLDATVSATVAAVIDQALVHSPSELFVAQVATDSVSSTLGILTAVPGDSGRCITSVDAAIRQRVTDDADLEGFATFWDASDDVLLAPARGCSTPTFRGSSADAMAVASTALSLLGPIAEARMTGGFLFALPHTPFEAPARTWISG